MFGREDKDQPIALPIIPRQVDLEDLDERGFLYTEAEHKKIEAALAEQKDGYYSKHHPLLSNIRAPDKRAWSIIKKGDTYKYVYYGKKHGKHLGEGTYGKVTLTQDSKTGVFGTIKKSKPKSDKVLLSLIDNEAEIWEKLLADAKEEKTSVSAKERKSSGSSTLIISKATKSDRASAKHDSSTHIIQMKYVDGISLYDFVDSRKLTKMEMLQISQNMLNAVRNFFESGYVHRDIKLENFIINPYTLEIHLIDFNLSADRREEKYYIGGYAGTFIPPSIEASPDNRRVFNYNEGTESFTLIRTLLDIIKSQNKKYNHLPKKNENHFPEFSALFKITEKTYFKKTCKTYEANNFDKIQENINEIRKKIPAENSEKRYPFFYPNNYSEIIKNEDILSIYKNGKEVFLIYKPTTFKDENEKRKKLFTLSTMIHQLRAKNVNIQFHCFKSAKHINKYLNSKLPPKHALLDKSLVLESLPPSTPHSSEEATPLTKTESGTTTPIQNSDSFIETVRAFLTNEKKRLFDKYDISDAEKDNEDKEILTPEEYNNIYMKRKKELESSLSFVTNNTCHDTIINHLKELKTKMPAINSAKGFLAKHNITFFGFINYFGLANSRTANNIDTLIKQLNEMKKSISSRPPTPTQNACISAFGGRS